MIERCYKKFRNFMIKYVGVSWQTTISGLLTVLSTFVLTNPDLLDFLPDGLEKWLHFFASLIAVASGSAFALASKDRGVTGGDTYATKEAKKRIGLS